MRRRDVFKTSLAGLALPAGAAPKAKNDTIYTRIGARPFINLTATYTINGGALTRPEVKRAMEEASYWPMNLDELMEHVGARLAKLLDAEAAIVTSGAAAALTHGTAACITGGDPEKMQQMPDLTGLKNEVIIPKASRNVYDHAVRTTGIRMVEIDTPAELERAMSPRTAMIMVLGTGEAKGGVRLEQLVEAGRKAKVPVMVDAAAELPHVPHPYLKRGADLVAHSGGKFLRGPQCAGLLLGRKDLVRAAWINSSPHHAFGRAMKVGKEEIMGMLAAIEVWRDNYDLEGEYKRWQGWLEEIAVALRKFPGVRAEHRPPAGASPFPVLHMSWDVRQLNLTAGEIGEALLNGSPRIMSHAEGDGYAFGIRPVAMQEGEARLVAKRLTEVLKAAPPYKEKAAPKPAAHPVDGRWVIDIEFAAGTTQHQAEMKLNSGALGGRYLARVSKGEIKGRVDGSDVRFRTTLPYEGATLQYEFKGTLDAGKMSGEVDLGEYGTARWRASLA